MFLPMWMYCAKLASFSRARRLLLPAGVGQSCVVWHSDAVLNFSAEYKMLIPQGIAALLQSNLRKNDLVPVALAQSNAVRTAYASAGVLTLRKII